MIFGASECFKKKKSTRFSHLNRFDRSEQVSDQITDPHRSIKHLLFIVDLLNCVAQAYRDIYKPLLQLFYFDLV